jgi:hypothetical protein
MQTDGLEQVRVAVNTLNPEKFGTLIMTITFYDTRLAFLDETVRLRAASMDFGALSEVMDLMIDAPRFVNDEAMEIYSGELLDLWGEALRTGGHGIFRWRGHRAIGTSE